MRDEAIRTSRRQYRRSSQHRAANVRVALVAAVAMGVASGFAAFYFKSPEPQSAAPDTLVAQVTPSAPAQAASGDTLYFGSKAPKAKSPGAVRLATYNIENLFDDQDDPKISGSIDDAGMTKPVDQRRAAAVAIKALDADILCVQEVESEAALKWFRDQHLQGLGYDYVASLDAGDGRGIEQSVLSRFPIKTVRTMAQIIEAVEAGPGISVPPLNHLPRTKRGVLSYAARDIGERLSARAIVAFTQSGDTVRRLARLHTRLPLLAFTPAPEVRSQLAMTWGVETFLVPSVDSTDAMVRQVDQSMLSIERFQPGDLVVIVAGSPPNRVGSTNLIRVHRLGEEDHA